MIRKPGGPLVLVTGGYLATKDRRGKSTLVHRGCWEAHNGPIPDGLEIHHLNGKPEDNRIGNLAMMTHKTHMHLHRIELPREEMVRRYKAGESKRTLGLAYRVGDTTILRRLQEMGASRRRPGPIPRGVRSGGVK